MAVKVRVPTPLMKLTDNKSEVTADGSNITEILNNLESQFAGIKERICEDDGTPRRFINIYLNEDDIRFLEGEKTVVKDGCLLYTSPSPRDGLLSRMPSSA